MVFTRKHCKDLGIVLTSPQEEKVVKGARRRQSKITNYFSHKEGDKGAQNELSPIEATSAVLDWSIQRKHLQTEHESTNYSMSLAQELALAENNTASSLLNIMDPKPPSSPQKPRVNHQGPQGLRPIVNGDNTEEQGDQLENQIQQICTDLLNITNFLAITNGLLLTLVDNFKQIDRAPDLVPDAEARTHTLCNVKPSKRRPKMKTKKSKNIKNIKQSRRTLHISKKQWQKLFDLLPSPPLPATKKPKVQGKKETSKEGLTKTKSDSGCENKSLSTLNESTSPMDASLLCPPSPTKETNFPTDTRDSSLHRAPAVIANRNELGAPNIAGPVSSELPAPRTKNGWNLVLNPNKVVFANYPKPPSPCIGIDRAKHLLTVINGILPGVVKAADLADIEYLYQDGQSLRALITFTDHKLVNFILRTRSQVQKREHAEHDAPKSKKEVIASPESLVHPCDGEDSVSAEEDALINRFWTLQLPAQTEILRRLDTLRTRLARKEDHGEMTEGPHIWPISPKCLVDKRTTGGSFKCVDAEHQDQPPLAYGKAEVNQAATSPSAWIDYLKLSTNEMATPVTANSTLRAKAYHSPLKQMPTNRSNGSIFLDKKGLLDSVESAI
nr:uncharacterized protein LOC118084674 [Zootoca vivipara]